MTTHEGLDEQIALVEEAVLSFQADNPGLMDLLETLGISIDEYERIVTGTDGLEFQTSNSSA